MDLKMRPMSEAPLNESLLIALGSGGYGCAHFENRGVHINGALGFWALSDLLRAAEILAAITPEGYEYHESDSIGVSVNLESACRSVYFRKLPPPVRYEFVAEEKRRLCVIGDWVWLDGKWTEICSENWPAYGGTCEYLCARRVEVKP